MRDTYVTDAALRNHPAADIDSVVADPDDIVRTFERNADSESRLKTHVLRLVPPFDGDVRAEPYVEDGPKRYPPDRTPEPIHLTPGTFVENEDGPHPGKTHLTIPTSEDARRVAEERDGTVDDATVETHHERLLDEWSSEVRDSLTDRVRIVFDPPTGNEVWTDARYESR